MKAFANILYILIILAVLLCLFDLVTGKLHIFRCEDPVIVTDTVFTKPDTIRIEITNEVPVIDTVIQISYKDSLIYLTGHIDTMAIIRDYFSRVIYKDTLTDDSTFRLFLTDTIFMNRIIGRYATYQRLKGDMIVYVTNPLEMQYKRPQLFLGGELALSDNVFDEFSINAQLLVKQKHIFLLGTNFLNEPSIKIGYYHKISFK
jgi:hypothetical protein